MHSVNKGFFQPIIQLFQKKNEAFEKSTPLQTKIKSCFHNIGSSSKKSDADHEFAIQNLAKKIVKKLTPENTKHPKEVSQTSSLPLTKDSTTAEAQTKDSMTAKKVDRLSQNTPFIFFHNEEQKEPFRLI